MSSHVFFSSNNCQIDCKAKMKLPTIFEPLEYFRCKYEPNFNSLTSDQGLII